MSKHKKTVDETIPVSGVPPTSPEAPAPNPSPSPESSVTEISLETKVLGAAITLNPNTKVMPKPELAEWLEENGKNKNFKLIPSRKDVGVLDPYAPVQWLSAVLVNVSVAEGETTTEIFVVIPGKSGELETVPMYMLTFHD